MKIYKVGGAVRDELLGLEPTDNDWVVVGSTPKQMLSMGYKQVGKGFPVFLHPDTKEEYALARKEKSTGPGHGAFDFSFSPSVTLEEDLSRRDITINAIAKDMTDGTIIDPFGGINDIENKIIKHVSESFREDPLRIFRVARFRSKFYEMGFKIDGGPERGTWKIMIDMLPNIIHLSGERIWTETEKALNYKNPEIYFLCLLELCKGNEDFYYSIVTKNSTLPPLWRWGYEEKFYKHHAYKINPGLVSPEAWWSIFSFLSTDIDTLNQRLNVPKRFQRMSYLSREFRDKYFSKYHNLSYEEKVETLFKCIEKIHPNKNIEYAINVGYLAAHNILGMDDIYLLKDFFKKYAQIGPKENEKKLDGPEIEKILNERKLKLIKEELNKDLD